jgi:hypothetical protein
LGLGLFIAGVTINYYPLMMRLRAGLFNIALAVLMVPSVLVLHQNLRSNTHMHLLHNGEIIKHSHPHEKSKSNGEPVRHSHSGLDLIFFGQLSDTETSVSFFNPVFFEFDHYIEINWFKPEMVELLEPRNPNPKRGPPSFGFFA